MDNLLKLSSTESKLPVKVDKDYEISIHGLGNILTTLTGSSVGYMQLKFNVINYGVIGNLTDRRAGIIYSLLCGACYFGTIDLFNYLPRFFLSLLLFFAGASFIAENLWGSSKYLTVKEWVEVITILVVFIFTGQLLIAVVVGGFIMVIDFVYKYAGVSCIAYVATGDVVLSSIRRSPTTAALLRHVGKEWLYVLRLKGFLFFGSAESVTSPVNHRLNLDKKKEPHLRMKIVV
jgi:MFS superfamily sulfate permease-like transporter